MTDPALPARFEIVAHTADFGIAGQAPTLPELFAVMARGLFRLIAEGEAARPRVVRTVHVRADTHDALLRRWLTEVNGLHHEHREVYAEFEVTIQGQRLEARVKGEPITERHGVQHEVKGITWHDLEVERVPGGYRGYVLLDV